MAFPGRAIAHITYINYAQKYGIPITKKDGTPKTIKQLAKDIHNYEMKHILNKPNKFGLYVVR